MDGRVWFWHGHVINEGDGFCSYAQEVVHVHRHAINANPTPLFQRRGDLKFTSHAVGRQRQQVIAEFNQSAEASR